MLKKDILKEAVTKGNKINIDSIIENIENNNDNPLYNHKYYPELINNGKLVNHLIKEQFQDYKLNLSKYEDLEPFLDDIKTLKEKSFEYLKKIISLEHKHKAKLEELAKKIAINELTIPNDNIINLNVDLTIKPTFEISDNKISSFKIKNNEELELIKKEIEKRYIVNALIEGFVKSYDFLYNNEKKEILSIEPKLLEYYNRLIALNDYLHYASVLDDDNTYSNKGVKTGIFDIVFNNNNFDKITINVNSIIFPTLIEEIIKSLLSFSSLNVLPEDNNIREFIYKYVDLKDNDFYNYLIGVPLWNKIEEKLTGDSLKFKPYVLYSIISKSPENMEKFIKELLLSTKESDKMISNIINDIEASISLTEITDGIEKKNDYFNKTNPKFLSLDDLENLKNN